MTHVVAIMDNGSNMPEWDWPVYAVLLVIAVLWCAAVERRRNIRRGRHVHYFSDADGACQTPGCNTLRRDRRSNA